jgi:uncharacterized membrane protein
MTVIQVDDSFPFAVRIYVGGSAVIWQPYNPNSGATWESKAEADAWAEETAQANIVAGLWPPTA